MPGLLVRSMTFPPLNLLKIRDLYTQKIGVQNLQFRDIRIFRASNIAAFFAFYFSHGSKLNCLYP